MDINAGDGLDAVAGLASLDDPLRRRLYAYVASCDEPTVRDDAAAAAGVSRTLAAYHLDKLAEAGILTISYARTSGRVGPGAGRPAKQYQRRQQELLASVPPRSYGLLAKLLAEAIATDDSGTVRSTIAAVARENGRTCAADSDISEQLREFGYEPAPTASGDIELRNCPFHQIAHQYTELVCGLNLQLIQGMLEANGELPQRAALAPGAGRCCVVVRAAPRGTHRGSDS
jgi:predicted ArsR family transcriptional regulator